MTVRDRATELRAVAAELRSDGRGGILAAVAGGWFLSIGVRMVYPAILPQLRATYGFDLTTAGLLVTALWLAYAIGQLPGGMLDDRLGGGRVLVASTAVSATALSLVVLAGSTVVLFGATVLFGLATSLYGVARFTILSSNFDDRAGTAIGATMAAGDFGNALLPPIAGVLAVTIAWEVGLGLAVPCFLLAAVGIQLVVPDDGRSDAVAADGSGTAETGETTADAEPTDGIATTARRLVAVLREPAVRRVATIQLLGYCSWQGFTAFYPTYVVTETSIAQPTATALFGGFFGLGIVSKLAAGSAYDGYGIRRTLPVVLGVGAVAIVLLTAVEGLLAVAGVTALASVILGYSTITLTALTGAFPDDVQGTGLGLLRTGYMLVGAGVPTVIGVFADADRFSEAFLLVAVVAAVAALLALRIPPSDPSPERAA
ncbi:Sugar phosphate permease [Halopenitus malekzadehii]|uniref:Sugar phosphate permease n=1 Tax=Halopenitus malekzadehii TaxID=1267564 RepID=A0A1H6JF59_9EURY|nr:MFS transporter [Halopenitus malekzadehii]SEH57519.1 Sugar phosphate permease [Halopenitus malekzadehii]